MLLETLLMVVAFAAAMIVIALVIPKPHRARWEPTWDNLARLCSECEHELRFHDDHGGCAEPGCRCRASRRKAFGTSLTSHELQARRDLHGL